VDRHDSLHLDSVTLFVGSPYSRLVGAVGRVVGPAMDEIAWSRLVDPLLRIVGPVRVRHGIEVIQVAKVLVKAVYTWQVLG